MRISPWGVNDYMAELDQLATDRDMSIGDCARRYGTLTLRENDNGWRFHPVLGFVPWKG